MSNPKVVEVAGCRLHWQRRGRGPTILFVQGTGVHGDGWRPQFDTLAADYDCVWFDNRGIGQSQPRGERISIERMALDARAVLDAAAVERAHVVGHSLGGMVAMQLALAVPERVHSLALLCTFANGRTVARGRRMFWIGLRTRLGTAPMRRRAFLELILPPAMVQATDCAALATAYAPLFGHDLAVQPKHVMAQIGAFRRCVLTDRLHALTTTPTLVVSGAHDVISPPHHGAAIAAAIPGARHVVLDEAAHGAPISHATAVNQLLREQLANLAEVSDERSVVIGLQQ